MGETRLLDLAGGRILAQALGDTPETVIPAHLLRQGNCKAYLAGAPWQMEGAVVQPAMMPEEPIGLGKRPEVLWELLRQVEGWECVLVARECAEPLGEIIRRELGFRVRTMDDVCHTVPIPVSAVADKVVRLLEPADRPLLEAASPELRASCWESSGALLEEGVVACGIVSGRVVATALTAARSERYAEIGVYTLKNFRRRGLATAAASLVVNRVQQAGLIPVWSAGAQNRASLAVAKKLGFVEVSRQSYVILSS